MRVAITGAASGIGAMTAAALRARSARVVGIDLVPAEGVIVADVRDADAVAAAVQRVADELGGLDVLINGAGVGCPSHAGCPPTDDDAATVDVNLFGAWRVTAAAMPLLLHGGGRVINIASGLAYVNLPYAAAYSASKRALTAYSDALRLEMAGRVAVTTIYPGFVDTPIHRRSEERGLFLRHAVPHDRMEVVVATILKACYARRPPRDLATSSLTRIGVAMARHFPRATDAIVRRRVERLGIGSPLPGGAVGLAHDRFPGPP